MYMNGDCVWSSSMRSGEDRDIRRGRRIMKEIMTGRTRLMNRMRRKVKKEYKEMEIQC